MTRRRFWRVIAPAIVTIAILGAVLNNQVRVYRERRARTTIDSQRQELFDLIRPVSLSNCQLERFGEVNDGGYLMCGNLLDRVQSAYSYGISGYDQWGCDISTRFKLPVHQYDCFNTTEPACPAGRPDFHAECVGDGARRVEGREFDTIKNQFARNGDQSKHIVLKIDVEGAEWESFRSTPDEVFEQIDQMSVEFHWQHDEQPKWLQADDYLRVMQRLKQFFEVAHVHFNNASCVGDLDPFPTWAYEVLFVNKQLARIDHSRTVSGLDPLDAPNNPSFEDCQPAPR